MMLPPIKFAATLFPRNTAVDVEVDVEVDLCRGTPRNLRAISANSYTGIACFALCGLKVLVVMLLTTTIVTVMVEKIPLADYCTFKCASWHVAYVAIFSL